ncbi:MAG TPA: DUF3179 domain-containing protein [candidate division WWE3 bacterium]|uniref:DUF3179 domain-containing protein n=1 Tax=candidate division WWE3 bacterium TaxID=2053526 RepID=A0A7C1T7I9_UNCKA|nr:DUF3179 domain-containing protein [candidate division WWE3 bacterium]
MKSLTRFVREHMIVVALLLISIPAAVGLYFFLKDKSVLQVVPGETITGFNINTNKFSVDPDKLTGGGPTKDGIPSIDNPKFETAAEAEKWLKDEDPVFGIVHKGEARAYPQRILVWHEIVNETIAGDPILITYCPLCGTAIAFERKIDGVEVEFGVSGKLYNSNLVMYSRINDKIKTESLWAQATGEAIVGDSTGTKLSQIPIDTVKWKDWVAQHSDTKVLSQDTGFSRDYNRDPYDDYYTTKGVIAPLENTDDRLFEKAVVFGVVIDGKAKAYPEEELKKNPEFTEQFAGKELKVIRNADGSVHIQNLTDEEEVIPTISFWFAWAAFYPESEIYTAN